MAPDSLQRADWTAEDVSVVLLNFNGADDTLACLESLAALTSAPGAVHVVDNASEDDSVERIRQAFPSVNISVNAANLGFGAGLNPVLETLLAGGCEWIWLLNNDTRVEPGTLDALLAQARAHPDAGAIGARIVDMDPPHASADLGRRQDRLVARQQPAFHRVGCRRTAGLPHRVPRCCCAPKPFARSACSTRAFSLLGRRRPVPEAARGRLETHRGPESVVQHRLSATTGEASPRKDELINASAVRFFRKHGPLGGWPAIVIGVAGRIGRRLLRGDLAAARAVWRGVISGFRGREP